jgi:hypothetical protein
MTEHFLKTWPEFYDAVESREKTFEFRQEDDRVFSVGDTLTLQKFNPINKVYMGHELSKKVTYLLRGKPFIPEGTVIMSWGIKGKGN